MVVSEGALSGTIGGGQLEFEAVARARDILRSANLGSHKRYPLGPELGQCCGGAVTLMFEPFSPADAAWVGQLRERASGPQQVVRLVELYDDGAFARSSYTACELLLDGDSWIRAELNALLHGGEAGVPGEIG